MKIIHAFKVTAISACMLGGAVCAQQISPESNPSRPTSVAFQPSLNQGTNSISAQKVEWTDDRGSPHRTYVFFEKKSHEIIKAGATNQVCYLNGKFYAVEIGTQAFSIVSSQPAEIDELTSESAADFATKGLPGKGSLISRTISLKSVLAPELERHLANPLFLKSVQPKIEDGKIAVYFESFTGLKGKTALDDKQDPISTTIISTTNSP